MFSIMLNSKSLNILFPLVYIIYSAISLFKILFFYWGNCKAGNFTRIHDTNLHEVNRYHVWP
ncbi:hypothetical protein HanRHA438_Chr07g0321171 [Helianthus annuus]|nr:hypothetical protein HanRHA438_Chr07g0321171 [Helianthus annuus]